MEEYILILGNGFNKALGLNVDYSNFFNSVEWAKLAECCNAPIIRYIKENKCKNPNIEDLLKDYIHSGFVNTHNCSDYDKKALDLLEEEFSTFVNRVLQEKIAQINIDEKERNKFTSSLAFKTMSQFQKSKNKLYTATVAIYSFCYTYFEFLRKSQDPPLMQDVVNCANGKEFGNLWGTSINADHVHGISTDNSSNIIFGLAESSFAGCSDDIRKKYEFLLKEKHAKYNHNIKEWLLKSLNNAKTIIFYGLGFTEPDTPYFEQWLQTSPYFEGKRNIVFYSLKKDECKILNTIKTISGSNWPAFYAHYDIQFHYETTL